MVRMVHRHYPQLPRVLLGRLQMCQEAGAGLPCTLEEVRSLALACGEPVSLNLSAFADLTSTRVWGSRSDLSCHHG
jgi:hypothetical protein